jgi:hypothetical protein
MPTTTAFPFAQGPSDTLIGQVYGSHVGQTGTGGVTNAGNQVQTNQYSGAQQGLQDQLAQQASDVMSSGQIGGQWLNPTQAQSDWANLQWQQHVAPMLAAQHGADSPALASSLSQMLLGLSAQGAQQGLGAYTAAANQAQNIAFTPMGSSQVNNQSQNSNTSQNTNTAGYSANLDAGKAVGGIMDLVAPFFP